MNEASLPKVEKRRTIYEWEQSLSEVDIYITPPPGVTASIIFCEIKTNHLTLGIKGTKPYLDEDFAFPVKTSESFWTFEDGEIHINLQKLHKGETWGKCLSGQPDVDEYTKTNIQKTMMLERFQEENPGFDFSNAEFNGIVPDPQKFMGGVKY